MRPSPASQVEEATAREGVCGECGRTTTVHWSATNAGRRCRTCHPAKPSTRIPYAPSVGRGRSKKDEDAEDVGDYDLTKYDGRESDADQN